MLTNKTTLRLRLALGVAIALAGGQACEAFTPSDSGFSISAAPTRITAQAGDDITIIAFLTCGIEFDDHVTLGLSNLPAGVMNTSEFYPSTNSCERGNRHELRRFEFEFTLETRIAAPGTYTVTVYGRHADERHEAEVVLNLEPDDEAPEVTIALPSGRQSFSPVEVIGAATDNGGVTRLTLSLDGGPEQELTLDPLSDTFSTFLDVSPGTHVITVRAWDGSGNVGSATREFVLDDFGNQLPSVAIARPADGAMIAEGETLILEGSATDVEDGELQGSALTWTSDRDGDLGSGRQFEVAGLSSGSHVITLTATDSEGASATAAVTIQVGGGSSACSQFTFTMTPSSVSVPLNGSASTTITLNRAPGFTAPVTWTLAVAGGGSLQNLFSTRDFDPPVSTDDSTVLTLAPGGEVAVGMIVDLTVTAASEVPQAVCTQPLRVTFVQQ